MKNILVKATMALIVAALAAYVFAAQAAGDEATVATPAAHFPFALDGLDQSPIALKAQADTIAAIDEHNRAVLAAALAAAEAARVAALPKPKPTLKPSIRVVESTNVNWDGIAQCETASNWSMQGSTYSGGLGFANTTWNGFGGREFAPNAGMATREQQIIVAWRVYARFGLSGWGCRSYG